MIDVELASRITNSPLLARQKEEGERLREGAVGGETDSIDIIYIQKS